MASENETVEAVIAAERDLIERAQADSEDLEIECVFTDDEVLSMIKSFESAWRRESEQLKKERNRVRLKAIKELQERMTRRNCDRFTSYKEAVGAWNAMNEYEREKHNQSFKDWLFAPVEKEGMK